MQIVNLKQNQRSKETERFRLNLCEVSLHDFDYANTKQAYYLR